MVAGSDLDSKQAKNEDRYFSKYLLRRGFEYLLLFELDWEWAITMFAGEHGLGGEEKIIIPVSKWK